MVIPFLIAGLSGVLIGSIMASADDDVKAKLQQLEDEESIMLREHQKMMKKSEQDKESMKEELERLDLEIKLINKRTEREQALLAELEVQQKKKKLLAQST